MEYQSVLNGARARDVPPPPGFSEEERWSPGTFVGYPIGVMDMEGHIKCEDLEMLVQPSGDGQPSPNENYNDEKEENRSPDDTTPFMRVFPPKASINWNVAILFFEELFMKDLEAETGCKFQFSGKRPECPSNRLVPSLPRRNEPFHVRVQCSPDEPDAKATLRKAREALKPVLQKIISEVRSRRQMPNSTSLTARGAPRGGHVANGPAERAPLLPTPETVHLGQVGNRSAGGLSPLVRAPFSQAPAEFGQPPASIPNMAALRSREMVNSPSPVPPPQRLELVVTEEFIGNGSTFMDHLTEEQQSNLYRRKYNEVFYCHRCKRLGHKAEFCRAVKPAGYDDRVPRNVPFYHHPPYRGRFPPIRPHFFGVHQPHSHPGSYYNDEGDRLSDVSSIHDGGIYSDDSEATLERKESYRKSRNMSENGGLTTVLSEGALSQEDPQEEFRQMEDNSGSSSQTMAADGDNLSCGEESSKQEVVADRTKTESQKSCSRETDLDSGFVTKAGSETDAEEARMDCRKFGFKASDERRMEMNGRLSASSEENFADSQLCHQSCLSSDLFRAALDYDNVRSCIQDTDPYLYERIMTNLKLADTTNL